MNTFLNIILIFLIGLLAVQLFFAEPTEDTSSLPEGISLTTPLEEKTAKLISVPFFNTSSTSVTFSWPCAAAPFTASLRAGGVEAPVSLPSLPCPEDELSTFTIPANGSALFSLAPWQSAFAGTGQYAFTFSLPKEAAVEGRGDTLQLDLAIVEPGFWGTIWREFFYRPLFNALAFFSQLTGSFGWGIVLLTVAMRLVLFWPFQRSMVSQAKLQKLQPQITALQKKYKDNQQQLAMETMALYKKHGVNPFSSCLPILIQLPFLLALFWIIKDGFAAHLLPLLYSFMPLLEIDAMSTTFLWMDLLALNIIALPLAVGLLQFVQMRLSLSRQTPPGKDASPQVLAMARTTRMMQYFLPAMIAVFTATLPAGVGLYWGVSTAFGIGQQLFVNHVTFKSHSS